MKHSAIYICFLAMSGCTGKMISAESIMGVQDQFRGISVGDNLEEVLTELDCAEITPYSNNHIGGYDELGRNATMEVSLELEDEQLVAIQADVFLPDHAEAIRILDALSELLTARYGPRADRSDFRVWLDQAGKLQPTEFAITEESLETGEPKLSITIYNFER